MQRPTVHPYLDHPGPIPFAHRGGASDAPENTMPAFERAVALGYRYLETDVQVTADGVLLAFHDDDLARTCDRQGRISELPWREVASARVSGAEPIPLLDDLLSAWPGVRLNIDCKSDAAVEALVTTLQRHDALHRVCLGAFSDRRLARLRRRLGPGVCTSLGPFGAARLVAAARTTHRIAAPGGALAAQIPLSFGRVDVVTPALVETAHRAGIAVHVWTIDEPSEMHRLLDLGVDGIMTDRPAVLRDVLERRGQWFERVDGD
jgi:glycerophosphoryl diester phosphodiesterase